MGTEEKLAGYKEFTKSVTNFIFVILLDPSIFFNLLQFATQ
jgi:hypothetical protein